MAYPQITYNNGADQVLSFTYPPVSKPGSDDRDADRQDSVSASGLVQSVVTNVAVFKNLQMDFVPVEDLPAWEQFIDYAIAGGTFKFFPDADQPGNNTYRLEDTKWSPKRAFFGMAKFALRLRKVS